MDPRFRPDFSLVEAFTGAGAAEADDLPADVACRGSQPDLALELGERAVEHDGLARQPLERAVDFEGELLLRPRPGRVVPLGSTRRGEQRMSLGFHLKRKLIATCNAPRRMNHDRV